MPNPPVNRVGVALTDIKETGFAPTQRSDSRGANRIPYDPAKNELRFWHRPYQYEHRYDPSANTYIQYGILAIFVSDPRLEVKDIQYTVDDANGVFGTWTSLKSSSAHPGWYTVPDPATWANDKELYPAGTDVGTVGSNTYILRYAWVDLFAHRDRQIKYRLQVADLPEDQWPGAAHSFDVDHKPEVTFKLTKENSGQVYLSYDGDEDTGSIRYTHQKYAFSEATDALKTRLDGSTLSSGRVGNNIPLNVTVEPGEVVFVAVRPYRDANGTEAGGDVKIDRIQGHTLPELNPVFNQILRDGVNYGTVTLYPNDPLGLIDKVNFRAASGKNLTNEAYSLVAGTDPQWTIVAISGDKFYVTGDIREYLHIGLPFSVAGSLANNGPYTVESFQYVSLSDRTEVQVLEAIPSTTVDGYLDLPNDDSYYFEVALTEKHTSSIEWSVDLVNGHGTVVGSHTFDIDAIPRFTSADVYVGFDVDANAFKAYFSYQGDEDTFYGKYKARVGSAYSALTNASFNGSNYVTGQRGVDAPITLESGTLAAGSVLHYALLAATDPVSGPYGASILYGSVEVPVFPKVEEWGYQSNGVGYLRLYFNDADAVIAQFQYRTASGRNLEPGDSWVTAGASVSGSFAHNGTTYTNYYEVSVTLGEKRGGMIGYRFVLKGNYGTIYGTHTFDTDAKAELLDLDLYWDDAGQLVAKWTGDEDTLALCWAVSDSAMPTAVSLATAGTYVDDSGTTRNNWSNSRNGKAVLWGGSAPTETLYIRFRALEVTRLSGDSVASTIDRTDYEREATTPISSISLEVSTAQIDIDEATAYGEVTIIAPLRGKISDAKNRSASGKNVTNETFVTTWYSIADNPNGTRTYKQRVLIPGKRTSTIEWQFQYSGVEGILSGSHTFDSNKKAQLVPDLFFDANNNLKLQWAGDEDCKAIVFAVSKSSMPAIATLSDTAYTDDSGATRANYNNAQSGTITLWAGGKPPDRFYVRIRAVEKTVSAAQIIGSLSVRTDYELEIDLKAKSSGVLVSTREVTVGSTRYGEVTLNAPRRVDITSAQNRTAAGKNVTTETFGTAWYSTTDQADGSRDYVQRVVLSDGRTSTIEWRFQYLGIDGYLSGSHTFDPDTVAHAQVQCYIDDAGQLKLRWVGDEDTKSLAWNVETGAMPTSIETAGTDADTGLANYANSQSSGDAGQVILGATTLGTKYYVLVRACERTWANLDTIAASNQRTDYKFEVEAKANPTNALRIETRQEEVNKIRYGYVKIYATEPSKIADAEFRRKVGGNLTTSDLYAGTAAGGSWDSFTSGASENIYEARVQLNRHNTSVIEWRFQYSHLPNWVTGSHTFDFDTNPSLEIGELVVENDGTVKLVYRIDEDGSSIAWRYTTGTSVPALPTIVETDQVTSDPSLGGAHGINDNSSGTVTIGSITSGQYLRLRVRTFSVDLTATTYAWQDYRGEEYDLLIKFTPTKNLPVPKVSIWQQAVTGVEYGYLEIEVDDQTLVEKYAAGHIYAGLPIVEVRAAKGKNLPSSGAATGSEAFSRGNWVSISDDTYTARVELVPYALSAIEWRIKPLNSVQYISGAYSFDSDVDPELITYDLRFNELDEVGQSLLLDYTLDEDCTSLDYEVVSGSGASPTGTGWVNHVPDSAKQGKDVLIVANNSIGIDGTRTTFLRPKNGSKAGKVTRIVKNNAATLRTVATLINGATYSEVKLQLRNVCIPHGTVHIDYASTTDGATAPIEYTTSTGAYANATFTTGGLVRGSKTFTSETPRYAWFRIRATTGLAIWDWTVLPIPSYFNATVSAQAKRYDADGDGLDWRNDLFININPAVETWTIHYAATTGPNPAFVGSEIVYGAFEWPEGHATPITYADGKTVHMWTKENQDELTQTTYNVKVYDEYGNERYNANHTTVVF